MTLHYKYKYMCLCLLCLVIMDTLLKLSLNNEKDDKKEYTSVDCVWLYAYVKVRISPVSICPIFT